MSQQPDLLGLLGYWQRALRLLDWRVEIAYVPDLQSSDGSACYGLCTPFVDDKAALIQIRDPGTPIDPSQDPAAAVERAVVHELLHLWWAPAGFRRPVEIAHEENAVWAITDALIAQKGTGRELPMARAMTAALGPTISTSSDRESRREQSMDLTTLIAALEAAVESGDMAQVEALIAKIKEASGSGGDAPPPEMAAPDCPEAEPPAKPDDDKERGQRSPAPRAPAPTSANPVSTELRAQLAELDTFKRDMLLGQRGHVLPEAQRKWAAAQPYAVVKGLLDATPEAATEPRAARSSSPTRGAGARGTASADPGATEVDRRMGVACHETPAVMIDPTTNKLFVSALKPVTVGVLGEGK